ncbi:MAG: hypothetical protein ACREFP_03365 [Acetobacteraceae bacterium]
MAKLAQWSISSEGHFFGGLPYGSCMKVEKVERSTAIIVETVLNLNRANFPLKSKAKKFDDSMVGLIPSGEIFCTYKSLRYDAFRESSGNEGEYVGVGKDNTGFWGLLARNENSYTGRLTTAIAVAPSWVPRAREHVPVD